MEQTRPLKRRRVDSDPVLPNLQPVQASSVLPTSTIHTCLSSRYRFDAILDHLSSVLQTSKVQGAQQASQTHPTNSKSNKGQTHQSKQRRLNPDPLFPDLQRVQAASAPTTNRVQDRISQTYDSSFINAEDIQQELPKCVDCVQCRGECGGKGPCQFCSEDNTGHRCKCSASATTAKGHVQKPQEARLLPPANSLEGIPAELKLMIFNFLPDVDTFDALVHASPVYHRLFAYNPLEHRWSRLTVQEHVTGLDLTIITKKLAVMEAKLRASRKMREEGTAVILLPPLLRLQQIIWEYIEGYYD